MTIVVLVAAMIGSAAAMAQAPPTTPKGDDKKAAPAGDTPAKAGDGEKLSFEQTKAASQMTELEERMFRLSEAIRALEPENASRLRLALKFSREELILQQMKETIELLQKLRLEEAATESKQVLAKLQRLHDLLLSTDLDFQMQLERLRLLRQILKRLDGAIKEEERQTQQSAAVASKQEELASLRKRRVALAQLVAQQAKHVEDGKRLGAAKPSAPAEALATLARGQASTGNETAAYAKEHAGDTKAAPTLEQAKDAMTQAAAKLSQKDLAAAAPPQQNALELLKKELDRLTKREAALEAETAAERFLAMRSSQAGTRRQTDGITDDVRKLGDSGASAASELIRASGSMASAEGELGGQRAQPAHRQQTSALESLRYASSQLSEELERLLGSLHGEIRRRVLEALTIMKERQMAVRESTQSLIAPVAKGSRQALASVVGLARTEGKIIEVGDEILALVEETEFGIALPAALRLVRRAMVGVQKRLAAGEARSPVVAAEKRIEEDLDALLAAMKQMPAARPSDSRASRGNRERERELNRLIAELRMIRLLQLRVNDDTLEVDRKRQGELAEAAASLRQAIEAIKNQQEEVYDTTDRLIETRSEELGPPP